MQRALRTSGFLLAWLGWNGCLSHAATAPEPRPGARGTNELLRAPALVTADGAALADAWTPLRVEWDAASLAVQPGPGGLRFRSADRPYAVGGVSQTVTNITAGQAYAVAARCELTGVAQPLATVLVRLEWLRRGQPLHPAGLLARGPILRDKAAQFEDVFVAPPEADGARLSLETKWLRGGTAVWTAASLRPTAAPPQRKVKVGTVYLRPRNSTPERNLDLWCEQVDTAGALGLDILCLSEAIALVGTQATASGVAEPIPGPATRRLGEAARRNRLWLVAGLMERDGPRLFNSAVLIDRQGNLAGTYRKIHLPREEWQKGITPGSAYPVFRTEFGTVAIQVCYDYFFPETAGIFAREGAEILFAPTWGTTFADEDQRAEGQTLFRARARDNGIFVVPSVYDGDSMVIDPLGRILASSRGKPGVFWAEIDLSAREPLWWVGHWGSIGPRDRMPETYRPLATAPEADRPAVQ